MVSRLLAGIEVPTDDPLIHPLREGVEALQRLASAQPENEVVEVPEVKLEAEIGSNRLKSGRKQPTSIKTRTTTP